MTSADHWRERANLALRAATATLLLICVLVQLVTASVLFRAVGELKEEKEAWHEHVQRQIERDKEHEVQREALRKSQLLDAARSRMP